MMGKKFEVDILKNLAQIAQFRPKINRPTTNTTLARDLLNFITPSFSSDFDILFFKLLVFRFGLYFGFWPHFPPRPHIGNIVCMDLYRPNNVGMCPSLPLQLIS